MPSRADRAAHNIIGERSRTASLSVKGVFFCPPVVNRCAVLTIPREHWPDIATHSFARMAALRRAERPIRRPRDEDCEEIPSAEEEGVPTPLQQSSTQVCRRWRLTGPADVDLREPRNAIAFARRLRSTAGFGDMEFSSFTASCAARPGHEVEEKLIRSGLLTAGRRFAAGLAASSCMLADALAFFR